MEILCREQGDDEVEQEVTQRDQFNTDEVTLVSTVIREPHQNSLDAVDGPGGPVRTRISIHVPDPATRGYFSELFAGLVPHLTASGIDPTGLGLGRPPILVLKDYGTTGLTGNFADKKEKNPFNNFWRRIGRSTKSGNSGGRWGLGKLVFSSASEIRTFFGLTIRCDDAAHTPCLMGQAVLANHEVDGRSYAPHVFFAERGPNNLQIPVSDRRATDRFREAFGITRTSEPGLSIAIPFVVPAISEEALIPEVLQNYFFPILTGRLVVEIGGETISEETFDNVSARYHRGAPEENGQLTAFVRMLGSGSGPDAVLGPSWTESVENALDPAVLEQLRARLSTGALVQVRAPLTLGHRDGKRTTYFDLYLMKTPDGSRGRALYVRSSITVPDEARYFTPRQTLGALVARDDAITAFLGDAENPAHTRWNGQADKLRNWKAAATRLREIRNSLNRLQNALLQAVETEEPEALRDLFSIPDPVTRGPARKKPARSGVTPTPGDIPPPPRPWYRIEKTEGGFTVSAGDGLVGSALPFSVKVRAAYDVVQGDAFAKYRPFDFDFLRKDIRVDSDGAECLVTGSNELIITVADRNFRTAVTGFDGRRDLVVRAVRQQ